MLMSMSHNLGLMRMSPFEHLNSISVTLPCNESLCPVVKERKAVITWTKDKTRKKG